jgi:hypothetical protein
MLVNQHTLISIEMVCLYHFLELFTGKYFLKRNLLILFLIYSKIINSAQSYDKIQWTTAFILQNFNVPETYKNKSLLKRMQNSGSRSRM